MQPIAASKLHPCPGCPAHRNTVPLPSTPLRKAFVLAELGQNKSSLTAGFTGMPGLMQMLMSAIASPAGANVLYSLEPMQGTYISPTGALDRALKFLTGFHTQNSTASRSRRGISICTTCLSVRKFHPELEWRHLDSIRRGNTFVFRFSPYYMGAYEIIAASLKNLAIWFAFLLLKYCYIFLSGSTQLLFGAHSFATAIFLWPVNYSRLWVWFCL